MASDRLNIEITATDKNAKKTIRGIDTSIDKLNKTTEQTTRQTESLWKSFAKGAIVTAATIKAFQLMVDTLKQSIDAYVQQEKADKMLAAAIESTGQSVDLLLPKYKALASSIQKQTILGDEVVEGYIAMAINMGVTADNMDKVIKGAIGLSKVFKIDMNMAIRAVVAAMEGNTSLLTRYIPQLRTVKSEAEKVAIVQKGMAQGWKQATAEADTLEGRLKQMKNAYGDLQEALIKGITGTTNFKDAIVKITHWIEDHQQDIQQLGQAIGQMLQTTAEAVEVLWKFKEALAGVAAIVGMIKFTKLAQNMSLAVDQGTEAMQTKLAGLPAKLGAAAVGWAIGAAIGKGIKKAIDEHAPWINEAMQRYFTYALNLEAVYHAKMKTDMTERYKLLKTLAAQHGYTGGSVKKMIQTVSKYWDVIKSKLEPSERKHLERLIKTQKELDRVRKAQEKLKKEQIKHNKEQIKHNKVMIQTQKTTSSVVKIEKQRQKIIKDVDKQIKEFERTEEKLNITIDKSIDKFGQLDITMLDLGEDLPTPQVIQLKDKLIDLIEYMEDNAEIFAEGFWKASQNVGDLGELLAKTGIISKDTAEGFYQVAQGLDEFSQGFSDLATGNYIGAAIHGISGLIDVLGGLSKALGLAGDGIQEAIDRERQMIDISDELAEQIHELAEEIGDTHAATSMYLADVIEEASITEDTFDNYSKRMHEILSDLDRGNLSAQETAEALGKAWNAMIDKAQKLFDGRITREMIDTIRDVKNRGLEVAEITEYIIQQLSSGVQALDIYWKNLGDSQEEYNRAVQYTMSFYNALQAEGKSLTEIMSIMGSAFDEALKKMEEGGYKATGAFAELIELRKKITEHQGLIDSINAVAQMLESLGNSAYLTGADFSRFQQDAISQFEKLKEAGFTNKEALQALSPMLENLLWYSQQYGFALDDQTKKLIEQAQAQGMLKEKTMPFQEKTVSLLEEIVKLLGGKIPYALDQLTKQADKDLSKMIDRTKQWKNHLQGVANVDYSGRGGYDGMPRFASGGDFIVNKPTPILVGEAGPERVVVQPLTKPQSSTDYVVAPTEININLDGQPIKKMMIEWIPKASKNGLITISPKAVR